jgi:anti-anti-sigma regulatory factor
MEAATLDIHWVQPATAVVALRGDFTLDSAPSLGKKLLKLSKKHKLVLVINLSATLLNRYRRIAILVFAP